MPVLSNFQVVNFVIFCVIGPRRNSPQLVFHQYQPFLTFYNIRQLSLNIMNFNFMKYCLQRFYFNIPKHYRKGLLYTAYINSLEILKLSYQLLTQQYHSNNRVYHHIYPTIQARTLASSMSALSASSSATRSSLQSASRVR